MLTADESQSSTNEAELFGNCSAVPEEAVLDTLINKDVSPALSAVISSNKELGSSLQHFIDTENWSFLAELLENFPYLAHSRLTIIVHGERTPCMPLHAVCARKIPAMDVLEQLVAFHPSSLNVRDHRMRLPLHLALLRGCTSISAIRYLCECSPQALLQKDADGNLPLHYACQYGSDEIIQCILEACPEAARVANGKARLPLHLVCSRNWDLEGPCVCTILEAYPEAARQVDRSSRLPLHWACDQPLLRYDVLSTLVEQYPAGLVHRDNSCATPVQLAKRMQQGEQGVVLAFLKERTARERRCALQNFFTIRIHEKNSPFPYG